jgi:ketosteroid isomerase-like protein
MTWENEKRVRAFYEALVPGQGHHERLHALQASHVIYDVPEGMPTGGGRYEGILDVLERFLPSFYAAFDTYFLADEFITAGEHVVASGRLRGKTRVGHIPIDVPFAHVWTVRDDRLEYLRFFTDTAILARALDEGRRGG